MLNIKNCFFSYAKTYKKALDYDNHEYKDERLKKVDQNNVELVNNVALFEAELDAYKKDLRASYKAETHNKLKKTDKEINKIFHSSKVMRSFRISCNHIELNMLHKPNDSEEQKRQNIINFYSDVLDQFSDLLNKNNKFGKEVQIVKADLHFDQTSPHLHIHVSNLYEREVKKLKRQNVNTCNVLITDAIRFLNQKKRDIYKNQGISLTPNEIFTRSLREKNKNYAVINKIDLKKLFPQQYNIFKLMADADIVEKDWRLNKERYFRMTKANLVKLGLDVDKENDINNTQKLNSLSYYCFIQSLFKELTNNLDIKQDKLKVEKVSSFLNNNEVIAKLLDDNSEVFNLEQALNKINLNLIRLNYKKDSMVEQFNNSLENKISKENKELSNSIETINSLIMKNNLDKKAINNELEHQTYLNKNSNLIQNFVRPDNLTQDKSLSGMGLNLTYFKPELKDIEQELINSLFLSQTYNIKNRLDYISQISLASTDPLTKLDLHLNNNFNDIKIISSHSNQFKKSNDKNNIEDDHIDDLSQSYNTNQTFKKNRSLKDIELEEKELLRKKRIKKH